MTKKLAKTKHVSLTTVSLTEKKLFMFIREIVGKEETLVKALMKNKIIKNKELNAYCVQVSKKNR